MSDNMYEHPSEFPYEEYRAEFERAFPIDDLSGEMRVTINYYTSEERINWIYHNENTQFAWTAYIRATKSILREHDALKVLIKELYGASICAHEFLRCFVEQQIHNGFVKVPGNIRVDAERALDRSRNALLKYNELVRTSIQKHEAKL